ncbi:MAG: mandelate racemase/muconate lactonizing enzyme family protein [Gemmatimonas sp.]
MKITRIEPTLVTLPYDHGAPKPSRHGMGNWATQPILLVRVDTDAGITGWGEAFGHASSPVTMTAVSRIVADLAVGREADDIAGVMRDLTRRTQSMARSGPVQFALSGLDIALWDIAGKAAGKPVWQLLGAPRAPRAITAYASLFRIGTPDLVGQVAAKAVARGYRHVKLHEHSREAVAAARAAIGPDVSLMVDTNCFWDSAEAVVAACRAFEPYDLAWLEEPLYPADSYDVLAEIRRSVSMPIAAGENLGNLNDLRWMAAAGAVDVIQPSVPKIGGITELWKAMAHIHKYPGIRGVPHTPFLGPALLATIHVIAALGGDILCEHRFCDLEASPLGDAVVARDGMLAVPDTPGLGFTVDERVLRTYRAAA